MKTKDAAKALGVSRATIILWGKAGILKSKGKLANGYNDWDEESVYEALSRAYAPETPKNRLVMFFADGRRADFSPSDLDMRKVFDYCDEKARLERSSK